MKNKDIIIITGCGRSGTTFLAKIIEATGYDFKCKSSRFLENKWLTIGLGFYEKAAKLRTYFFLDYRLGNFYTKIGDLFMNHVLKKVDIIKVPELINHIGNIDLLGYNVKLIGVRRDYTSTVKSMLVQNKKINYQIAYDKWERSNENLSAYLHIYESCLISYENLVHRPDKWVDKLSRIIKKDPLVILEAHKRLVR